MARYFVPITDDTPQAIEINGHRLVILSKRRSDIVENTALLGAEEVREMYIEGNEEDQELAGLALAVNGGVVISPPGMDIGLTIYSLKKELPWVH